MHIPFTLEGSHLYFLLNRTMQADMFAKENAEFDTITSSVQIIFGEERPRGWGSLVSVDRRDPDFFVSPDPRGGGERSQNMLSREWSSLVWDAASEWLGQAPSYHQPKVEIPLVTSTESLRVIHFHTFSERSDTVLVGSQYDSIS